MNAEDYMNSDETGSMIKKYIAGELSNAERHALEKAALDDPFLTDALQGLEMSGTAPLGELSKKFEINASSGSGFTGKFFLGITVVAAIGLSAFYLSTDVPKEEVIAQHTEEEKEQIVIEKKGVETIQEQAIDLEANTKIIEEKVKVDEVLVLTKVELPEQKYEFEEEELESIPFEEIEPIQKIETTTIDNDPIKKTREIKVRASNMDLEYFYHMKVVDYSDVYRNSIKIDRTLNHGTPAYMDKQGTDNGVSFDFEESVWIDYMEYLEPTMKLVSKGRNKLALRNFDMIFENFPDDANAQFYSGLCSFYLKRHEDAIELFDAVKANTINTFHEEADWHRLLCYKATGQKALFKILKEDIIELGGFYSERAEGLEL